MIDAAAELAFQEAVALHRDSRLEEAERRYQDTVNALPHHAQAWHLLGIIALQRNDPASALDLVDRALALDPQAPASYNSRGTALTQLGRHEAAVASYDRAIALQPDFVDAHYNRGNALHRRGRYEAALADYDRGISLRPDYPQAYSNRGLMLSNLKRHDAALASYDKAIALEDRLAIAHSNRGLVLAELKRPDAALESYDRAIHLNPEFAEAYSNRSLVLKDLGRLDAALADCDRALALMSSFAEAHSNRGLVLKEMGRTDAALAAYDRAIALKPDFAEAHSNRGLLLQDLHLLEAALASYERAVALDPHFAVAHFNRAMAWLLAGNYRDGWLAADSAKRSQNFSFANARRASPISGLPGLSEFAQTRNNSRKYLAFALRFPMSCAACAAPYSDRKRRGSLLRVAANCSNALVGMFTFSNISPSSSRAGASGPGVTTLFSVPSSIFAAASIWRRASRFLPTASAAHAETDVA